MTIHLTDRQRKSIESRLAGMDFDERVGLVRGGRPHEAGLAHLKESHAGRETAEYVLLRGLLTDGPRDGAPALAGLMNLVDKDPMSPTFGCTRWYFESDRVVDTNAAFFVGLPLACYYLIGSNRLPADERRLLFELFSYLTQWFAGQAANPNLAYPNKSLSDAALLYTLASFIGDERNVHSGIDFCRQWFDYWKRRGCGWGEDHSMHYTRVLVEAAQLILTNDPPRDLRRSCIEFLDDLAHFAAFHEGRDPTPGIRNYNFDGDVMAGDATIFGPEPTAPLIVVTRHFADYQPPKFALPTPRQIIRRTFDGEFSVSWAGRGARLGTLSRWPLMPNTYHHDTWGLGWQSMPAGFIANDEDHGFLQWMSVSENGVRRSHPAENFHDFKSRPLFKRISFHPEVQQISHQSMGAAIIFREIRRLHTTLERLVDRWRIPQGNGEVLLDGRPWNGKQERFTGTWCVLRYESCAIGISPLHSRPVGSTSPRRLPLLVRRDQREGLLLEVSLYDGDERTVTEPLLFTGWCVVVVDQAEEIEGWHVSETFETPLEVPRTYREPLRKVTLTGPGTSISLQHDSLEDRQVRR